MAGQQNHMDPEIAMGILLIGAVLVGALMWIAGAPAFYWMNAAIKVPQLWVMKLFDFAMSDQKAYDVQVAYDTAKCIVTRCDALTSQVAISMDINGYDENEAKRNIFGAANSLVSAQSGSVWRFFFAALLGYMAFKLFYGNPQLKYHTRHTLDTFRAFQARAWRMIAPVVKSDPLQDKKEQWGLAMTPKEWVEKNDIEMIDIAPDREAVRNALARQLRRPWAGAKKLRHHERALLAAFALKMNQRNAECTELLAALSQGWAAHGSVDKAVSKTPALKAKIEKILADKELGQEILKHSRNHAFVESAFANMLQQARKRGGVMASAEFLWLKAEDRGLWYVLNGIGRPTYHIEGAGAVAHWKAEQIIGRPLPEPDVDEAVFGLEEWFARGTA